MTTNEIIEVKQLPVIVNQLQTIKADVTERVNDALSLVCNEETVKTVKTARAELTKEFKGWEERRKQVKVAVMSPYEQFETVYKDCITDVFKTADTELKGKIDSVENELKEQKQKEVQYYFEELCEANDLAFYTWEKANINITLSASLKSLKDKVKESVDRVCDDLRLIDTQEHKDEILYEYKQTLNVSAAITTVANRNKAIEESKAVEEERRAKEQAQATTIEKVENVIETLTPPTAEENDPILTLVFKVTAPKSKLRVLKEFLNNGGYDYE